MKTMIEINCEDQRELLVHLSIIRLQIKRAFRIVNEIEKLKAQINAR